MHGKRETPVPTKPQSQRQRRTSLTIRAAFFLWSVSPLHLRPVQQSNRTVPLRNVPTTLHPQLLQTLSLAASPEQCRRPQLHYLSAHPVDAAVHPEQPWPRRLVNSYSQARPHGAEQSAEAVTRSETGEEG